MCPNLIFCLILSISQCVNLQTPGDFCLCLSCSIKIFCLYSYLQDVVEFLSHCEDSLCRSYLQQFLNSVFSSPFWSVDSRTSHISCARYIWPVLFAEDIWSLYSVLSVFTPSGYPAITHWAHSAIALHQKVILSHLPQAELSELLLPSW